MYYNVESQEMMRPYTENELFYKKYVSKKNLIYWNIGIILICFLIFGILKILTNKKTIIIVSFPLYLTVVNAIITTISVKYDYKKLILLSSETYRHIAGWVYFNSLIITVICIFSSYIYTGIIAFIIASSIPPIYVMISEYIKAYLL